LIKNNISKYRGKTLIIIIFILFSGTLISQNNGNSDSTGTKARISGIVIDKDANHTLEAVTISVIDLKDSLKVKGAETDKKGMFTVEVPYGRYKIEANFIGYSIAVVNGITVNQNKPSVILDTIKITQGTTTTEEIDVTGEKSILELTPDKKVFNVSETPVSSNGSATDILKNVPTVSVDNSGNVSLRGNPNVRILIDGRPVFTNVSVILETIPASSVDNIELITNPSAKYEAEGEAGIINIVLKKNANFGYNGSVVLSTGTKDKYNISGNINIKNNKLNIYGNLNLQSLYSGFSGTSLRFNTVSSSSAILDQPTTGDFKTLSDLGKVGLDYKITDKQTIGISSTLSYRKRDRAQTTINNIYDAANSLFSKSFTNSDDIEKGYSFETVADYNAKFKTAGQQFSMQASYSHYKEDEPINLTDQYNFLNYSPSNNQLTNQYTIQNEKQHVFNLQSDYTHPLGKESRLEAGFKSTYRFDDNSFFSENQDTVSSIWIPNSSLNNEFKYTQFINALYATYSNKIGNFGFQAGLRTELTHDKGELVNNGTSFTKNYIDFFPSASISEKLGKTNEFQLSYSRRLNRPRTGMLNPFGENVDPFNIRKGNPDLNPEYINSFELSFMKYISNNVITSSLFFRDTRGLITRIRTLASGDTTFTTFANLSRAYSYGIDVIANLQTPKWLSLTGSFSYYRTDIKGDNVLSALDNSGYAWNTKFLASVKMWFGFDLQMSYYYLSKRPTADGYIQPIQAFDVSIKKSFMKQNLEVGMRVSDVFNTQEFQVYQANQGYTQNSTNKRDSRVAYLTLTYKFGNLFEAPTQQKNKNKKPNEEDTPDIGN
jgi:outer membrane receptor protein involved in Fe transport